MRIIDADALKDYMRKGLEDMRRLFKDNGTFAEVVTNSFCKDIDEQPTVDAVPVVRCRDCKWYQPDADKWCGYFECMGFEPDDYCSQGERKDGDSYD